MTNTLPTDPLLVNATAIAIDGRAVLFRGPSGAGKSDLALRLIDDGARLVADDQVELRREGEHILVRAPATIAGLIEIRGVGILRVDALAEAKLAMFADLFRKKIEDWELVDETEIRPLGDSFWVPDFCLIERSSGGRVLLEVLGFWRRASVEKHLGRLRAHASEPFLLAVSEQLRLDEGDLEGIPAEIVRFRQMPLPDEVARLARELLNRRMPIGK